MEDAELALVRRRLKLDHVATNGVGERCSSKQRDNAVGREIPRDQGRVGLQAYPLGVLDAPQQDNVQPVSVGAVRGMDQRLRLGEVQRTHRRFTSALAS